MPTPQFPSKTVDEVRNCRLSLANKLDVGEVVSATTALTVTIVQGTSALIVSSVAVSTAALTVNGSSNAAGQVVTWIVSAGLAYTNYKLKVAAPTDAGQTLTEVCALRVDPST
jgi:hypothetical protein